MHRKYKKNSWVGKIYKWVNGHHYDTDSCSVRKAVFWDAPIKVLFKQKLFYFGGLDENIGTWFIWHTAIQVYLIINRGRIFFEEGAHTWLDILALLTIPIVGLITVLEVILLLIGIGIAVATLIRTIYRPIDRKAGDIGAAIGVRSAPVKSYLMEWWDEVKNKVCKPVTWVE